MRMIIGIPIVREVMNLIDEEIQIKCLVQYLALSKQYY